MKYQISKSLNTIFNKTFSCLDESFGLQEENNTPFKAIDADGNSYIINAYASSDVLQTLENEDTHEKKKVPTADLWEFYDIYDVYNNVISTFEEFDVEECFGGGVGTTTANFAPAVTHTMTSPKKQESKLSTKDYKRGEHWEYRGLIFETPGELRKYWKSEGLI